MKKKKNDIDFYLVLGIIAIFIFILPYIFAVIAIVLLIKFIKDQINQSRLYNRLYNRENCLQIIGHLECLNENLTNKILFGENIVSLAKTDVSFENMRKLYKKIFQSIKIRYDGGNLKFDNTDRDTLKKYNIEYSCTPLIIRFLPKEEREIVFYVFPETILSFAEGEKKVVFIGAYNFSLLNIWYEPITYSLEAVVEEKSRNPIEYYYEYNPVPDAEIVSCDWLVKNMDGSRSFKGGLLPEHNPLIFQLKYAKVNYQFGQLLEVVEYSNYNTATQFVNSYVKYSKLKTEEK